MSVAFFSFFPLSVQLQFTSKWLHYFTAPSTYWSEGKESKSEATFFLHLLQNSNTAIIKRDGKIKGKPKDTEKMLDDFLADNDCPLVLTCSLCKCLGHQQLEYSTTKTWESKVQSRKRVKERATNKTKGANKRQWPRRNVTRAVQELNLKVKCRQWSQQ